jgi:ketosteroid isomerase-like protein
VLESNKDIVRRAYAVYATGDVDTLDALLSPDYVDHNPVPGQGPGVAGVKDKVRATRASLTGIEVRFDDQVAEADKVASRVTLTARGPDGSPVSVSLIAVSQLTAGTIVAEWGIADTGGA